LEQRQLVTQQWAKVDSSAVRPLNREQKLRPMLELLADLEMQYGRDPDPVRSLLILGMGLNPNPNATAEDSIPMMAQLEALKAVAQFVRPKLQNVQVTGVDEGPVKVSAEIAHQVGTNEDLLRLAEEFAIKMATKEKEG
jgi:hypothetical protein